MKQQVPTEPPELSAFSPTLELVGESVLDPRSTVCFELSNFIVHAGVLLKLLGKSPYCVQKLEGAEYVIPCVLEELLGKMAPWS